MCQVCGQSCSGTFNFNRHMARHSKQQDLEVSDEREDVVVDESNTESTLMAEAGILNIINFLYIHESHSAFYSSSNS